SVNNITLDNTNNVFNGIAALTTNGAISLVHAGESAVTVASLSDDIGNVDGMTANNAISLISTHAASSIVLDAAMTANLSGNSIVLSSPMFINHVGASALNPGSGRFLVWSINPANDDTGGMVYDFKQYGATF